MSSEGTQKILPGKTRRAEEQHLKETVGIIRKNVERYSEEVALLRTDIDDMQAHFHDDNPELINTLENTYTMYDFQNRTLERNLRALKKPYFGRIDFHDETLDIDEAFYIGKCGISKDATHPLVIDWRAPVANVYYDNGLGKCSYLAPEGHELPIDLKLKRTYEIADGKLLNMFDTEVIANDELLTSYLSKNKQAVLGEIVATIQKEQNDIIRKSPYHNCLVQGVAGSGKTTVAMHRISYILYNYADRFKPEDFYIVGSNRILLNYITSVLPDLDVYGIKQMTMEQLFIRLLYEDWDEKTYSVKGQESGSRLKKNACKGTISWFRDLEQFCQRLEQDSISFEPVYLNRRQFVEGIVGGKAGVHDLREGNVTIYESDEEKTSAEPRVLLMSSEAIVRYIRENPNVSIQSKINMLNERLRTKIKDEFLGKEVSYTEAEMKAILKSYHGWYGGRSWKGSIFDLYQQFLLEQISGGHEPDVPTTAFDVYDLAALAYLYKRVKETEVISEAHHVVIDEAQDFGMMVYSVLKFCIKDCTYTIMGDVSQNIHFDYGLNDWEELKSLYISDLLDSFGILKKSYRNTVEISKFATKILQHGTFSTYPVEPIIRHGEEPKLLQANSSNSLFEQAAAICREWQEKGLATIAIICRDETSAKEAADNLRPMIELLDNPMETAEFGNGVMVLPVEYTKGLEFDAVLILEPSREDYPVDDGHAKLLYVAATRALHELCVLYTDNLTGLLADPTPTEHRQIFVDSASKKPAVVVSRVKRPDMNAGTDTTKLLTSKKFAPNSSDKSAPTRSFGVNDGPKAGALASQHDFSFGSMPSNDLLRPMGYVKADRTIRWVNKQSDGMYLPSTYGILRISPIAEHVVRISFAKDESSLPDAHPMIAMVKTMKGWKYRESPKLLELVTGGLYLQVDKATGTIYYMTADRRPLLAERSKESRILEKPTYGNPRARLYLEWTKNENLYALGTGIRATLALKGTARYISHTGRVEKLPMVVSDKGYGLVIASADPTLCSTLPTYGAQICVDGANVLDYYFIFGKTPEDIIASYRKLCGDL
ncbi:MAG: AAA family ATPase [Lachnospiraceae bacterium]|nr:AAA family ATPase [Lachnospiraceae bacterium]